MKISYENNPPLKFLKHGQWGEIGYYENDPIPENIIDQIFKTKLDKFKQIDALTNPFVQSALELKRSGDGYINPNGGHQESGTFIVGAYTFFYELISGHEFIIIEFRHSMLNSFISASRNHLSYWVSKEFKHENPGTSEGVIAGNVAMEIGNFVRLKRNDQIESKYLNPRQKIKDLRCKYKNETDIPVTIINITWFTTLIKQEQFKVRGHFRWQPCGQGFKDRKLRWISEFEKGGYTAPARKLSDNNY